MAPKTKSTMKQQALGFTTKRLTAASNAKLKESLSPVTVPSTPTPVTMVESTEASGSEAQEATSASRSVPRQRKTRAATKAQGAYGSGASKKRKLQDVEEVIPSAEMGKGKQARNKKVFNSRASLENVEDHDTPTRVDESSDVEPQDYQEVDTSESAKKARVRKYYGEARKKMGYLAPIHAKGQTKEDHILRVFDLSYEYGPCVGMTRLQRWERADTLGLNPPLAVKEILLDELAKESTTRDECVFFGEV
ncbi:DNA polymerase delta, subunit 4-domain-containing protein [Irpex rosettiformis]|uniref:DNA polymerase delta, subunit 4-domain-containing protein n=1 Tax=Irpex rosettiformis TaxID=378272 RepID=A0ACB8UAV2_9APHY|nr:DNA polymerase delta, subunit 4-domain-containing protein [Irpex rosettiformis]